MQTLSFIAAAALAIIPAFGMAWGAIYTALHLVGFLHSLAGGL